MKSNHSENISKIESMLKRFGYLSHASNILIKENDRENGKLRKEQEDGLKQITDKYASYLDEMSKINGITEKDIRKKVKLLNEYYNFIHVNEYDNLFTSQGKFRPTILEEFMYILFSDYVKYLKKENNDRGDVIHCGSAKSYTNLYFSAPHFRDFVACPTIEINVKDQDFAIYRDIKNRGGREGKNDKTPSCCH